MLESPRVPSLSDLFSVACARGLKGCTFSKPFRVFFDGWE
jgi:hypothetical protein